MGLLEGETDNNYLAADVKNQNLYEFMVDFFYR